MKKIIYIVSIFSFLFFSNFIYAETIVVDIPSTGQKASANVTTWSDGSKTVTLDNGSSYTVKKGESGQNLYSCSWWDACSVMQEAQKKDSGSSEITSTDLSTTDISSVWWANGRVGDGSSSSASKTMTVIVTEEIPWAKCDCINDTNIVKKDDEWNNMPAAMNCGNPATRKYSCEVKTWLAWFQATFAELIRYSIYIVMLLGVLGIVGLGIAWAFAGGDDVKAKTTLKTWWVNIVVGLTILFLFTYILRFLAPWIFQ